MKKLQLAIVDVETTGGKSVSDRIIEIAILKVIDGRIVKTFHTLLNPGSYIPYGITAITGISDMDLIDAPAFEDVVETISEMLKDSIFVAHNVSFDYGFVKNEFKRLGLKFKAECLCTVKLSRLLFPKRKSHNLDSIIEKYDFSCEQRHRALDDAKVLFDFLSEIQKTKGEEALGEAIASVLKAKSAPSHISPDLLRNLPEGPGVYIFKDEHGEPLYVGKSINIRNRVLSHFAAKERDEKELTLSLLTHDIECEETPGELGALLLESRRIKELAPTYNRLLRRTRNLFILRAKKNEQGFLTPLWSQEEGDYETSGVLGVFRSKNQLVSNLRTFREQYSLCHKLLGLEKGTGPCFYYQMRKCNGGCAGKEAPEIYNERFLRTFEERMIRTWPFKGEIVIEERKSDTEGEAHIIDNWRLVRSVSYGEMGEESSADYSSGFDYDSYKILARYILNPKNLKHIKPVESEHVSEEREMIIT